jgi:hypothetical protein
MSGTPRSLGHKHQQNPDRRTQACLKCDQDFVSEWNGHRLCHKCQEVNSHASYERPRGKLRGLRERRP